MQMTENLILPQDANAIISDHIPGRKHVTSDTPRCPTSSLS